MVSRIEAHIKDFGISTSSGSHRRLILSYSQPSPYSPIRSLKTIPPGKPFVPTRSIPPLIRCSLPQSSTKLSRLLLAPILLFPFAFLPNSLIPSPKRPQHSFQPEICPSVACPLD